MRPFMDLQRADEVVRMWTLAEEVYSLVLELGGTISTQHGTGLARTPWVSQQYGPLYPVFRDVKAIFDPRYLFNPGKIVGPTPGRRSGRCGVPIRDRGAARGPGQEPAAMPNAPERAGAALGGADELAGEIASCNGCGQCRTERCRAAAHVPDLPRRPRRGGDAAGQGQPDAPPARTATPIRALSSDEVRAVADLCVNCKMCARECPAHVNIPKLMLEAKAANVAQHGLDRTDWALARTELFAAPRQLLAPLANALLANRHRPLAARTAPRHLALRRLPAFAPRNFLRRAWQRGWTRKPRSARPRVAYFVDIFANYNDPLIAEAVVAVLHHNGIEVYVPPGQNGCGMAPLAHGDVETARETLQQQPAHPGRPGPRGLSDPLLRADRRADASPGRARPARRPRRPPGGRPDGGVHGSFLWDLHQQGRLQTDFQPLEIAIGHHVPCHLKALGRHRRAGCPDRPCCR